MSKCLAGGGRGGSEGDEASRSNSDRGEPTRMRFILKPISWVLPLGQTVLT